MKVIKYSNKNGVSDVWMRGKQFVVVAVVVVVATINVVAVVVGPSHVFLTTDYGSTKCFTVW